MHNTVVYEVSEKMGEKTSIGVDENIAGALCYILGIVSGIVLYILEKDNKFVRFHAVQSIIVFGSLIVVQWILVPVFFYVPVIGSIFGSLLSLIVSLLGLVLWILLIVKAYQGETYKVPVLGDIAEKQV